MKKGMLKGAMLLCLCMVLVWGTLHVCAAGEEPVGTATMEMKVEESEILSFDAMAQDGTVALKDGNYQQWIQRLDMTGGEYALDFYEWLESNCTEADHALLDPTVCQLIDENMYVYEVKTFTGTGWFTYTGNGQKDTEAAYAAIAEQLQENGEQAFAYITAAYSAFDRDHPEVFWLSGKSQNRGVIKYSYYTSGRVTYTQHIYFVLRDEDFDLRSEEYQDPAALETLIDTHFGENGTVDEILAGAAGSNYDMVRYFNRWLTENNCYNSNVAAAGNAAHECLSALTGSVGSQGPVCEGYARALKVLCDRKGIPCVLVDGTAVNSTGSAGAHMWNYVQMENGAWYGVDVTWNDPTVSGVSSAKSGYESENYLLVGGETVIRGMEFLASHPVTNRVTQTGTQFINGPELEAVAYQPVEEVEKPVLTPKSFTLSFEDEILVNLYYTVSDMTNVVEQGLLVFYNEGEYTTDNADDVYIGSVYDPVKDRYMSTTEGIAAKEMGDTRYYVAYVKLTDGSYAYTEVKAYSPKQYAVNMLNKTTTSDTQKALCVAMLNFGAAAQNYFNYNTDNLMNSALTDAHKALNIGYDESLFTGAVAADSNKIGAFVRCSTGYSKRSATVSFEGAFVINYYFTPSMAVKGDVTFYYWTPEAYADADVLSADNASGTCAMVGSDGVYFAQVTGIAPKALDKTYYVAGVYTDEAGNEYCTGVIAYSLSKYCINQADTASMGELAKATAMYGYYAKQNFADK